MHSGNSNSAFIVVFDSATGAVMSARGYSSSSYYNYGSGAKSMIVSSTPSPMAYVLSKIRTVSSCGGQ